MRMLLLVLVAGTLAAGTRPDARARTLAASVDRAPGSVPPSLVATRADTVREYRGLYEAGFEVSWFHPCDAQPGDDSWWVTLTDVALRQRDSLAKSLPGKPGAVFVRWRGTTSAKMPAGHMGRGSRYMLVSEVLQVRAASEVGCAST
jgi:hypothetical protein